MQDLELAKTRLKDSNLSLVIAKNDEILFETKSHGIKDFLLAIEKFGDGLGGVSIADRIIGRAAALLCVYSKAKEVFAVVMSEKAMILLKDCNIYCEAETLVSYVLGRDKESTCPFEKLVMNVYDPIEAYEKLKLCAFKVVK